MQKDCRRHHSRLAENQNAEGMMKLNALWSLLAAILIIANCGAEDWTPLWKSYAAAFMDNQIRVIDHDAADRTTSEGQAYAMFFALVANDRSRFDGLLHWTEVNLASGDLATHLPSWLWGRGPNDKWGVLDSNSASDADVWMAYTLLQAGKAWNEPHYTSLGTALAKRIAAEEVVQIPGFGTALLPGARGFHKGDSYRLNASYVPLQLFIWLGHEFPDGPWKQIPAQIPALVSGSAPQGFASDWVEFKPGKGFTPSPLGSYDAVRAWLERTAVLVRSSRQPEDQLEARLRKYDRHNLRHLVELPLIHISAQLWLGTTHVTVRYLAWEAARFQ